MQYYDLKKFKKDLGFSGIQSEIFSWIKNNFLSFTFTGQEQIYQIIRAMGTGNNTPFLLPTEISKKPKPVFFCKGNNIFINKEGVLSFIETHQKEIQALGVPFHRIQSFLYNIPYTYEQPQNAFKLYDVAFGITKNSKTASAFSKFIQENFLTAIFKGQNGLESMFVYYIPPRGKPAFYLKEGALDEFKHRFNKELTAKAQELNQSNQFITIRRLSWELTGGSALSNKLTDFIKSGPINDRYPLKKADGTIVYIPPFQYVNSYLSVDKRVLPSFVKKYEETLKSMGASMTEHLILGIEKPFLPEGALSLYACAKWLGDKTLTNKLTAFVKSLPVKKRSCYFTSAGYSKSCPLGLSYSFLKDKEEYFVKDFQKELVKLGFSSEKVNFIVKRLEAPEKTADMLHIRLLLKKLALNPLKHKPLLGYIMQNYLNETYSTPTGETRAVFKPVKTRSRYFYVYDSKEAMQAFAKKHKELFLSHGVNPLILKEVTGELEIIPFDKKIHCAQSELTRLFRKSKLVLTPDMKADGVTINNQTEPLFFPVRKKWGHIAYAVNREDIPLVVERYKEKLKLTEFVEREIKNDETLRCKTDNLMSLYYLGIIVGHSGRNSLKAIKEMVENHCMEDTFTTMQNDVQKEEKIFTYAFTPIGNKEVLYIQKEGIVPFLSARASDLEKCGVSLDKFIRRLKARNIPIRDYIAEVYKKALRRQKD